MTNTVAAQAIRGSVSTDGNGSRQATVVVPPGTQATITLPNGTTQSLSVMHVRATEYTVGPKGAAAMPLDLPKTRAYTYAVSFNVDEATAVGADRVQFSQTVYGYVENFLQFPVGTPVPSGYHDHDKAQWLPENNGLVVRVLGVSSGTATVDVAGQGIAADGATLASLGFSTSELQKLATTYPAGQSLWRVPLQHFSCYDWNWPPGLPPGVPGLTMTPPKKADKIQCDETKNGSIIECMNETLGETIDVVGTPYSLNYRSDRTRDRSASRSLRLATPSQLTVKIPGVNCGPNCVSDYTVDPVVSVSVAGQPPSTKKASDLIARNLLSWDYQWNGLDAYDRPVQGEVPVTAQVCESVPGYVYDSPMGVSKSFALANAAGDVISASVVRDGYWYTVCSPEWHGYLGGWDARPEGMGGWTLSAQHGYDFAMATLYRGDGETEKADELNRAIVHLFGGNLQNGAAIEPNGIIALGGQMAIGPDGSLYGATKQAVDLLWRITPDKVAHVIAGAGVCCTIGDGGPAANVSLSNPTAVAVGPDGSVYVIESSRPRIRRIDPKGVISTVAGNGTAGFSPDGTIATQASLSLDWAYALSGLVVAPDGRIIFSDVVNNRVRMIGTDGILRTIAGAGPIGDQEYSTPVPNGDGGPALQATLGMPRGIALAKDGTIFFVDNCGERLRKISQDQMISTVLYSGWVGYPHGCYGGVSGALSDVVLDDDGTLFVTDRLVIKRLRPDGSVTAIAGSGNNPSQCSADSCPGTQFYTPYPLGLAMAPNHSLFFVDVFADASTLWGILYLSAGIAQTTVAQTTVPSADGSQAFVLDGRGKHVRTIDTLTGVTIATLGYDAGGLLVTVTDRDGNVTTVPRDAQGNPTAIVGPFGQRTTLTVDSNGYLASIADPALQTTYTVHGPGGLLTQLTDPRGGLHAFAYDAYGFLIKDTQPGGPFQTLDRGGFLDPSQVTHKTALGRTTAFVASTSPAGDSRTQTKTDPAGLATTTSFNADHTWSVTSPVGVTLTGGDGPDPRFGINSPIPKSSTAKMPSGLTRSVSTSRSVSLSVPTDPLSVASLTDVTTVNGRNYQSAYNRAAGTITSTTPAGRSTTTTLDALGHVTQVAPPGVSPTTV